MKKSLPLYVRVKVTTGARREQVTRPAPDHFVIAVKEPAKNNLANHRVCTLIAQALGLPPAAVRIINGHHQPTKLLTVVRG